MQTFLPYPSFKQSAEALDYKRLGKQRVEAKQIYDILTERTKTMAWIHHPALLMWKRYEDALALYYNCIRQEWIRRGFNNTMPELDVYPTINFPCWLGNDRFHASHKGNLLRKDPVFYGKYGWTESPDLPYIWPTKEGLM
jgi:hypothetical protein